MAVDRRWWQEDQRCGTCKWWDGPDWSGRWGVCNAPLPAIAEVACDRRMRADWSGHCPCWEPIGD